MIILVASILLISSYIIENGRRSVEVMQYYPIKIFLFKNFEKCQALIRHLKQNLLQKELSDAKNKGQFAKAPKFR